MGSYKALLQFRKMQIWAIRTMFAQNNDASVSLGDLRKQLDEAWNILVEEGEITIIDNETE